MSDLADLLRAAGVKRALVVDDAFDVIPLATDLSLDLDEWSLFFDDLTPEDRRILGEVYPRFEETQPGALRTDDFFVEALWTNRARLPEPLVSTLFARYETDSTQELEVLNGLVARIRDLGVDCQTCGRVFREAVANVDLVFIDLFLGATQGAAAIAASIDGLREAILPRIETPPLVVLMSRSPRLREKREEFRDGCGLFETSFRIIPKTDLRDSGRLERILARLALHYADSLKLAAFLYAWQTGLSRAGKHTSDLIRKVSLADLAHIRQLILSAEGEPTGCYLVDVFDRVLQHEIEREAPIIDAAMSLNSLTSETYPPPYVAGSPDLQNLVHRALFQNRERLRLKGAEQGRLAFGDILRRKAPSASAPAVQAAEPNPTLSGIERSDVLAVMTPACDLQRRPADKGKKSELKPAEQRVLLLAGGLHQLKPSDWSYKGDPIRTPVIEMANGERYWIKWNLKHIEALSSPVLESLLDRPDGLEIVARLRESHALELQQRLLASLGRVGQLVSLPATFPMSFGVFVADSDGTLVPLSTSCAALEGVCYVGRSPGGKQEMQLVITEDVCETICEGFDTINLDSVSQRSKPAVLALRTSKLLAGALDLGVTLPEGSGFKPIASSRGAVEGQETQTIGLISYGLGSVHKLTDKELAKAAVVILAADVPVGIVEATVLAETPSKPDVIGERAS